MIMEKKLIPAPIDNKNVTTDWIEDIFDYQTCVWGKKCAVGFINSEPVIAGWKENLLIWQFPITTDFENSISLARLKDRLEKYSENNPELVEHYNVFGNMLMQKFYWKSED